MIPDKDSTDDDVRCGDHVKLTALIRASAHVGMQPLCTTRRRLVAPCAILHHDTWDAILCAGVPVSLRELVSLSLKQLQLRDNQRNRQKMLQCSWELGWHVTSTLSGVTYHYWGGGVTPDTTDSFRRGDWVEVAVHVCEQVVWLESYVGLKSETSNSFLKTWTIRAGKALIAGRKTTLCISLLDTRCLIRTVVVNAGPNTDLYVRESCEIHTVCGSGLNDMATSVVAAGERGLGIGTNIYLEIRWSNRNEEKSRNVVPGTISSSLITYLVTQTLHRIGTDLILFCSLLYGLNHHYYELLCTVIIYSIVLIRSYVSYI